MDLELTEEQTLLDDGLTTLLQREWLPAEPAHTATPEQCAHLTDALGEFFADEELGAVELCLAARRFGVHLASTPFLAGAASGYAGFAGDEVDVFAAIADGATLEKPSEGDIAKLTTVGALLAAAE